jgi:DNA-directed RNA polymerase subunit E'/Rpb7
MTGDANSYTPVEFRYIVFQPFRGEIIQGTIASCGSDGIWINIQFFRDIFVPPDKLPKVSKL